MGMRGPPPSSKLQSLFFKLGLIAPENEFNLRAARYAFEAKQLARHQRIHELAQRRKQARNKPDDSPE